MDELLVRAAVEDWPVYFLGATQDVLDRFLATILERHQGLNIVGACNGYFSDDERVADAIAESGARLLFVAMPSPRKEFFSYSMKNRLGPLLVVGVGGSFDVVAGLTARAPRWMQRAGLEWFYRFAQEPRRLWRRYLIGNARFIAIALREIVGKRR
jgi:N-acetylglucosaminyldiphosphoundecaprenol N-acetyl-beta-D-mannosaminyltransferase